MGSLTDWITEWITEGLISAIMDQFSNLFATVNEQIGEVAAEVGQTPQGWNYACLRGVMILPTPTDKAAAHLQ
jgi:hypothetical protein